MLDPRSAVPLYCQLANAFRDAIVSGKLRAGDRVLPSRELQLHLGISRTTALNALGQLQAEGYVETIRGSGTFVSGSLLTSAKRRDIPADETDLTPTNAATRYLSAQSVIRATDEMEGCREGAIAFRPGIPATDSFPSQFRRALNVSGCTEEALANPTLWASERLRTALAQRLQQTRGVVCSPDQILVVPSLDYAVSLIGRALMAPLDPVVFEEPGCPVARSILVALGARLILAPIDDRGLDVRSLANLSAAMAFVTPSHQYPLGSVLSLERRIALLQWASSCDAWIVENDYDSEFSYLGQPQPTLHSLDDGERVLYMSTFSKILSPSIQLAFIIVPRALRRTFEAAHQATGGHASPILQAALAVFIESGQLSRHLVKMRRIYDTRRRFLSTLLSGAGLRLRDSGAGLHFVAELPRHVPDTEISRRAADSGIVAPPLSRYFHGRPSLNGVVLGFAATSTSAAKQAAQTLCSVL